MYLENWQNYSDFSLGKMIVKTELGVLCLFVGRSLCQAVQIQIV